MAKRLSKETGYIFMFDELIKSETVDISVEDSRMFRWRCNLPQRNDGKLLKWFGRFFWHLEFLRFTSKSCPAKVCLHDQPHLQRHLVMLCMLGWSLGIRWFLDQPLGQLSLLGGYDTIDTSRHIMILFVFVCDIFL